MPNLTVGKTQKITITVGIMLVMFLASLDMLIVANALPKIADLLDGKSYQTWAITVYTLTMTVVVPVAGKLSDLYGRKHIYIVGILWFTLGSGLVALSGSMLQLIILRGVQAIGGGIVMGVSMAIIADVFPPAEVGKYMGIIMSMSSLASLVGPTVGGFLVDHANWHWVFLINVPVGVAAAIVLGLGLPALKSHNTEARVDYLGAVLIMVFTIPLMLALTLGGHAGNGGYGWSTPPIIGLFILAVLGLVGLVIQESRTSQPIIPITYFRRRAFTVVNATNFLITIAMFGTMVFMPQLCQYLLGYSPTMSGGLQTPLMVCMMIASIICGQLVARLGTYKAITVAGGVIAVISCLWLLTLGQNTGHASIIGVMAVFGVGMGMVFPTLTIVLQNTFTTSEIGAATASFQFFKNFATSLGVAILGATLAATQQSLTTSRAPQLAAATTAPAAQQVKLGILSDSFHAVFLVCAGFAVLALIVSVFLPRVPLRHDEPETAPHSHGAELEATLTTTGASA